MLSRKGTWTGEVAPAATPLRCSDHGIAVSEHTIVVAEYKIARQSRLTELRVNAVRAIAPAQVGCGVFDGNHYGVIPDQGAELKAVCVRTAIGGQAKINQQILSKL